jgi:hypothetical protein
MEAPLGHIILIPSQPLHHPYDFNRCDTTYYAKLPFYFVEIYFRLPFTICGAGTGHPSGTPGFTPLKICCVGDTHHSLT